MKKIATVGLVVLVGLLSACGTTQVDSYAKNAQASYAQQTANTQSAISQAPEWMSKLPKSTSAVYESATAVSGDFGMADMKAKTIAYAKICTAAGGKIRSQTKVFRQDTDTSSNEQSEMAIRSICPDVDITGVETVEMKHVAEGNRIRTYVLVALPFGEANQMRIMKQQEANTVNAKERAPEAFNELDTITNNKPVATPVHKGDKVGVISEDGSKSAITLLPVDNAAYKAKRDEALQKPGAVVGQTTVSN